MHRLICGSTVHLYAWPTNLPLKIIPDPAAGRHWNWSSHWIWAVLKFTLRKCSFLYGRCYLCAGAQECVFDWSCSSMWDCMIASKGASFFSVALDLVLLSDGLAWRKRTTLWTHQRQENSSSTVPIMLISGVTPLCNIGGRRKLRFCPVLYIVSARWLVAHHECWKTSKNCFKHALS